MITVICRILGELAMKISVEDIMNQFKNLDPKEEIFVWYRCKDEYPNLSTQCWSDLYDDSEELEDMIETYINGWIEELN